MHSQLKFILYVISYHATEILILPYRVNPLKVLAFCSYKGEFQSKLFTYLNSKHKQVDYKHKCLNQQS